MSQHYLDPEREPRYCDCLPRSHGTVEPDPKCPVCSGTGHLGVEGAEPEIDITRILSRGEFYFIASVRVGPKGTVGSVKLLKGQFPTEDAALEAARAAHREQR